MSPWCLFRVTGPSLKQREAAQWSRGPCSRVWTDVSFTRHPEVLAMSAGRWWPALPLPSARPRAAMAVRRRLPLPVLCPRGMGAFLLHQSVHVPHAARTSSASRPSRGHP